MVVLGLVLVTVGLVVLGGAVLAVLRLRAEVGRLRAQATEVAARVDALPPELARPLGAGDRHIITVELLNLFELAHRESALTRPLTVLTPRLLRDLIHRRLVGRIRDSLAAAGVRAEVRVHRVGG